MTFLVKIVTHSCAMNQGEDRFFSENCEKNRRQIIKMLQLVENYDGS